MLPALLGKIPFWRALYRRSEMRTLCFEIPDRSDPRSSDSNASLAVTSYVQET